MTRLLDYRLATIEAPQEREFLARWHYSRKAVPNSAIRLGCFSGQQLVGVVTFGRIINCKPIFAGTSNRVGLEINRMAMVDQAPKNSESWFLMRAIKLVRKKYDWLRFISTWADGLRCQGGTIYKACGFLYLRKHEVCDLFQLPNGEVMHMIAFNKVYLKRHYSRLKGLAVGLPRFRAMFGPEVQELGGEFQYHFVYLLDPSLRSALNFGPLPYEPSKIKAAVV